MADLLGGGEAVFASHERKDKVQDSIICGVDGSRQSLHALRTAANMARRLDARLVAAHVADPIGATFAYDGVGGAGGLGRAPVLLTGPEVEREAAAAVVTRSVVDADAEIAEQRVLSGNPAESLADFADEEAAMLIVVGSRGRGAVKAAFLGSCSGRSTGSSRPGARRRFV
jgi:nucleotide-binding universal stress UspA family protein